MHAQGLYSDHMRYTSNTELEDPDISDHAKTPLSVKIEHQQHNEYEFTIVYDSFISTKLLSL